nr:hypothetical protein KitaXyl93_19980 [Kitasatospora sp. Xyl93]
MADRAGRWSRIASTDRTGCRLWTSRWPPSGAVCTTWSGSGRNAWNGVGGGSGRSRTLTAPYKDAGSLSVAGATLAG